MAFTDEENEEKGQVQWFNKRERFKNVFMGRKMWDTVANFGFHTLPNGKIEVYHHGEYFVGRLPLISLGVKIAFQIQARWVAWATEHHLNHHAFTAETKEEVEMEEMSRTNHILYLVKYHFWKDFKAVLGLGTKEMTEEEASFLSLGTDEDTIQVDLPIKRIDTRRKVKDALSMDKEYQAKNNDAISSLPEHMNAYQMAQKAALQKHQTLRVMRRKTTHRPHEF